MRESVQLVSYFATVCYIIQAPHPAQISKICSCQSEARAEVENRCCPFFLIVIRSIKLNTSLHLDPALPHLAMLVHGCIGVIRDSFGVLIFIFLFVYLFIYLFGVDFDPTLSKELCCKFILIPYGRLCV